MEYLLTGYRQATSIRVFTFDGVAADRSRTEFTVSVDTGLIGRYAIGLQELPLLCRQLLELRATARGSQSFTFAESDMARLAAERAEAHRVIQQRKSNRKFPKQYSPKPSV